MSRSVFIDKDHRPSDLEVVTALGTARSNWTFLLEDIRKVEKTQEDFKFLYGKPYGWGMRFRLKNKLLVALYPNHEHFVAQIILGPKQLEETEQIRLHSNAREAVRSANLYAEGKWLFIMIESRNDIEDVTKLLKLKMKSG